MIYDDYEVITDVAGGRITAIDLVERSTMNLLGSGSVEWKPDSSTMVEGFVEIWD